MRNASYVFFSRTKEEKESMISSTDDCYRSSTSSSSSCSSKVNCLAFVMGSRMGSCRERSSS